MQVQKGTSNRIYSMLIDGSIHFTFPACIRKNTKLRRNVIYFGFWSSSIWISANTNYPVALCSSPQYSQACTVLLRRSLSSLPHALISNHLSSVIQTFDDSMICGLLTDGAVGRNRSIRAWCEWSVIQVTEPAEVPKDFICVRLQ